MNQFDPLANPVLAQGSLSANLETLENVAAEAVIKPRFSELQKQIIVTAVAAVVITALTAGIYASLSHARQVAAQQELQRNSRVVVL